MTAFKLIQQARGGERSVAVAALRRGGIVVLLMMALAVSSAFAKETQPLESVSASRMESRTQDPTRDPGIFGDYWWANRFLSRHQLVESVKGKTVDVVMIGDSIMHFWEWKHPASWKRFTAGRTVLNLGYGGDRTQHLIWRIEHGELDGYAARYVVLMIGTNNNSDSSTDPRNVAIGIEKIIDLIHAHQPQAKVVLHPIFPRGSTEATLRKAHHESARQRNDQTNVFLKQYAAAHPEIIWVDFNDKLVDASGWVPKELMADQIHPTDAGYDIWMSALGDVIK